MFASLEGMAKDNAKMIDENGDLHVTRILDGLDSLYGVSMTFQSLNAALCSLQQRPIESARTYYNRMVQITVILRECHGNHYRPGELARMSKDCFYAGLLHENRPMVVHLKDEPHLLRALLQQEESDALTHTRYPPSISTRPSHPQKLMPQYLMTPWMPWKVGTMTDSWQAAAISESQSGCCFNCQKEGHYWHQCKETLSPELQELSDQQDREREEQKKRSLNPKGGVGVKGGHAPTPLVGANPALPQVPGAPTQ